MLAQQRAPRLYTELNVRSRNPQLRQLNRFYTLSRSSFGVSVEVRVDVYNDFSSSMTPFFSRGRTCKPISRLKVIVTVLRSRSEFINFPKLWWGDASIKNDVAYLLLLVRSSHVQQLTF